MIYAFGLASRGSAGARFAEVGGADGIEASNTYALEAWLGWTGPGRRQECAVAASGFAARRAVVHVEQLRAVPHVPKVVLRLVVVLDQVAARRGVGGGSKRGGSKRGGSKR